MDQSKLGNTEKFRVIFGSNLKEINWTSKCFQHNFYYCLKSIRFFLLKLFFVFVGVAEIEQSIDLAVHNVMDPDAIFMLSLS